MDRLGTLLPSSLNRHGAQRSVVAARVVDAMNVELKKFIGPDADTMVVAQSFVHGEVRIAFTDARAASEVRNRQEEPGLPFQQIGQSGERRRGLIQVLNLRLHDVGEVRLADRKERDVEQIDLVIPRHRK